MPAEPIRETFSLFGVVLDVHLPKDPRTGDRKNFGFVTFASAEAATTALSAGQVCVGNSMVNVSPAAQSRMDQMKESATGGGAGWSAAGPWGGDAWGSCGGGCAGGQDWTAACWPGAGCGWGGKGCDTWSGQGGFGMNGKGGGDEGASSRKRSDGTRYFLPGLPDSVTEYELREHFSRYGVVLDTAIVKDKGTERSRGFGYVTMQDPSTREVIISATHEFAGRPVTVMLTKDSLAGNDVKKVHLSRLGPEVSVEDIRQTFLPFGTILDVHTPKDPNTGERKNFAFVTFDTQESFDTAIAARSVNIRGADVNIKPASQCRDGPPGGGARDASGGKGASSWGGWGSSAWGGGGGGGCGGCGAGGAGPSWSKGGGAWQGSWGSPASSGCWGSCGKGCGYMGGNGCGYMGGKGCGYVGGKGGDFMGACRGGDCMAAIKGGDYMVATGQMGAVQGQSAAPSDGKDDGAKYFIAALPEWVTDEELWRHFSAFGQVVSATVVKEKQSGRSRGFAYMTMASAMGQETLLNSPHVFGDKAANVMLNKECLTGGNVKKIHLGNLNVDVSPEAIRSVFSQFGVILDVHTPKDPATGERRNYGFVSFSTDEAFQAAISTGAAVIGACEVTIRPAAQSRMDSSRMESSSASSASGWDASTSGGKGCCGNRGWGQPGGKGGKAWSGWDGSWQEPSWGSACGGWGGKGGGGGGMWDGKGGYGEAAAAWGCSGAGKGAFCGGGCNWGCSGNDWGWKGAARPGPY
uniref:RRM domain-containing protein n=1 Tax=Alexandrium catenella TaxID=2925 RepID=A0A7S1WN11_ALECA